MLRVIVSGSRYATVDGHLELIGEKLQAVCHRDLGVLAHGGARGVDLLAAGLAETWGWRVKPIPALWAECDLTVPESRGGCPDWPHRKTRGGRDYCPRAGNRRNQRLVELTPRADVIVAFPDQRRESGTRDFIRRAKAAGYDPQVHELKVELP